MKLSELKLFELVGVKKFYGSNVEEVITSMVKNGYKELGRGYFAITLQHSTKPEVVKFWVADSSYDDFINYVVAHPSKYFPKLYSKPKLLSSFFLRSKNFPEKVKYVRMEVLQPLSEDEAVKISGVVYDIYLSIEDDLEVIIKHHSRNDSLKSLVGDIPEFCREMYKFINAVVSDKNKLDLHGENVMKRTNGSIVITDPIYNREDFDLNSEIKDAINGLKKEEAISGKSKTPKKEGSK